MPVTDYGPVFGAGVAAFTTDASSDFHHGAVDSPAGFLLTAIQRDCLLRQGISSPDDIVFPRQVHGAAVWVVDRASVLLRGVHEADAVVTDVPGLPIAVRTADCLPVLVHDPAHDVVAAVHAGWRSTYAAIVRATLAVMREKWGTEAADIRAALGPCIRTDSYEVGPEFEARFPRDVVRQEGRLLFDIASANVRQLLDAGIRQENIFDCGQDTFTDRQCHSFRRDGESAGRMVNVIMMK